MSLTLSNIFRRRCQTVIQTFTITTRPLSRQLLHAHLRAMAGQKRGFNEGKRHFKKNKKAKTSAAHAEGSNEEVLLADVQALLQRMKVESDVQDESKSTTANGTAVEVASEPELQSEVDLEIQELSSTGDGLAYLRGRVYVVPFAAPGDVIRAKVFKHLHEGYTLTDFVAVATPSPLRTETPKCKYFTQCSGCQFQHLPYAFQLEHKRRIVQKAYTNFSRLPSHLIPEVGATIGSPLQYGYRTKLTPHFDGPPGGRRDRRHGKEVHWDETPPIGFMKKGTRQTMDIEECPIGTEAVQQGMTSERTRVDQEIEKYQRGATILLRESTERVRKDADNALKEESGVVLEDRGEFVHRKTCITDHKATSTEYVEDFRFDNPAGSFFQNNNSILPHVTQYIRENILSSDTPATAPITNMIDAYCGSGFFTITLSRMFSTSIGIDISGQSIDYASKNAALNDLPQDSTQFLAADANQLFASVDKSKFPPSQTVVVIDPPRKGCDVGFITQLLEYRPARICYVSCNVHTQARDVGWLVAGLPAETSKPDAQEDVDHGLYEIESLRGFDFFPQTGHVEGVAILRLKGKRNGSQAKDSAAEEGTMA
nr:trna (uracil(54)-c(5))-methyltransferase [Quercus suber]